MTGERRGKASNAPDEALSASAASPDDGLAVDRDVADPTGPADEAGWPRLSALDLEICLSTELPGRGARGDGRRGAGGSELR